jgi:sn1-specific diacylglycerol lipase
MVLAGYGGASLLFFGVGYRGTASAAEMASEETQLANAIDASEAEAAGEFSSSKEVPSDGNQYSWWDVLLGKHDQEIFERAAGLGTPSRKAKEEIKAKMSATAVRFFLLFKKCHKHPLI